MRWAFEQKTEPSSDVERCPRSRSSNDRHGAQTVAARGRTRSRPRKTTAVSADRWCRRDESERASSRTHKRAVRARRAVARMPTDEPDDSRSAERRSPSDAARRRAAAAGADRPSGARTALRPSVPPPIDDRRVADLDATQLAWRHAPAAGSRGLLARDPAARRLAAAAGAVVYFALPYFT